MTVAALYIDPRGPYPKLLGPDMCWDETRDARTYAGPWPVVAHPPCGPWGRLRHMCTKQDRELALRAVEQVRQFGGVLEHPAGSKLWDYCGLPKPGTLASLVRDSFGGHSIAVNQCDWGHAALKPTWLYLVRVDGSGSRVPEPGTPTHCVSRDAKRKSSKLPRASHETNRRTPVAFAEWLISLAQSVNPPRAREEE